MGGFNVQMDIVKGKNSTLGNRPKEIIQNQLRNTKKEIRKKERERKRLKDR